MRKITTAIEMFLLKKKGYLVFAFSLVTAVGLNIYFRIFPVYFPQLKSQAQNMVMQRIRQQAMEEITKRFPEYDAVVKDRLVGALVTDYKRHKREMVNGMIQEQYAKLKERYQDKNGQTYLMELDCWHWARYVENVYRSGTVGDKLIHGRSMDTLMLAPSGYEIIWNNFLFYLSAFLYRVFPFARAVPLFTFLFYLPLFFMLVFLILLYLFSFYRWGNLAAFISCLFVGLSPVFLPRSCAGWFDTDILNLLFPLLIVWTYLLAYDSRRAGLRTLWLFISAMCLGLFCWTWTNWWFILVILVVYEIYSFSNLFFVHLQYRQVNPALFRRHLFSLFLFLIFAFFWIMILAGFQPLLFLYRQLKEVFVFDKTFTLSIWPNVYPTVEELKRANFSSIAYSVGGLWLFISSLIFMLTLFLHTPRNTKYTVFERECSVLLTLWFAVMFFACLKGIRFTVFILIPLGVSLGWGIKQIYGYAKGKNPRLAFLSGAVILCLLGTGFVRNGYKTAQGIFPMMDDFWHRTLVTMKERLPADAIINSWWDFGDWFESVSRRRVIFDGQSQNIPQAYWMAHALITDNEEEAIGILRMLDNAGNKVFEIINGHLHDPFRSVLLLKKIISLKPDKARENLLNSLPAPAAEEVMRLLFAPAPKAYFLVDYTMPGKINALTFLGNRDFVRLYLAENLNKKKPEIIDYLTKAGIRQQQTERLYDEAGLISGQDLTQWVSPSLKLFSGLVKGEEKGSCVLFNNGMVYSPREDSVYIFSPGDNRYLAPKSIFLFRQDRLEEISPAKNGLEFSALILKAQEGYEAVLLDRKLANSLLIRLYFLDGRGLKHFKPVIEESEQDRHIRVFEIIWD